MSEADRLLELREVLMRRQFRPEVEDLIVAILLDLDDLDDDEEPPLWLAKLLEDSRPPEMEGVELDVGAVRERLRWTLAELAARDGIEVSPWRLRLDRLRFVLGLPIVFRRR